MCFCTCVKLDSCILINNIDYHIFYRNNAEFAGAIAFYEGNSMLYALAKYVINRLIHGLFHIALVISPRLISSLGLKPSWPISRNCADNKGNMKKVMH